LTTRTVAPFHGDPFFSRLAAPLASLCLLLASLGAASPALANGPYSYSADETANPNAVVTDSKTGLAWRRCSAGQTWANASSSCTGTASTYTHEQALAYAKTQPGWRLPNVKELASLADLSRTSPAIDVTAFPGTPSTNYWSASPYAGNASGAWDVDFDGGSVGGYGLRDFSSAVRLVR